MRWEDERESSNVEDVRGFSIGGRGAGIGCGGLIVLLLVSWITGINPARLLNLVQQSPSGSAAPPAQTGPAQAPSDRLGKFASVVLASTEDVWKNIFAQSRRTYEEPKLVLFSNATRSGCGFASAVSGPFYCPEDHKVYLDLAFFRELSDRFGAPGEFADAYVIAHEVGHHVQNLLGTFDRYGGGSRNRGASVRIELQADCYAGVWGYRANRDRHMIEPGDFEAGLRAASAIGDDRLQRQSQGYVSPETFTHGSSSERTSWLRRGLETGDPGKCDTFRGE